MLNWLISFAFDIAAIVLLYLIYQNTRRTASSTSTVIDRMDDTEQLAQYKKMLADAMKEYKED